MLNYPVKILIAALLSCMAAWPACAQKVETVGAACTQPGYGEFWEQSSICPSGTLLWQRPAFQFGPAILGCTATTGGLVQWTGTGLQVCDSASWMDLTSTGGSNSNLGNSVTTANPHRIGGMVTGLFSNTATSVSIAIGGAEYFKQTSSDLNISGDIKIGSIAKAYYLDGNKILAQPASDTTSLAVGTSALASQTITNAYHTAVGYQALQNSTATTGANTAIGYRALNKNTYGYDNIAIGRGTLYQSTTAADNIAIGEATAYAALTGSHNIGINTAVLARNTSGSYNIGINTGAVDFNKTGSRNIGVGANNLLYNSIGNGNVAMGWDALTSTTGSYNIGLTYNTYSPTGITSGNNNIITGKETTRNTLRTGSNNILIATSSGDTPASDTSNWLYIGNLINGDMAAPQLGIATASPQATLDVNGYARLASNSSQPVTCDSSNIGAIALTSSNGLCMCGNPGGSATWVKTTDGMTSCIW